MSKKKNLTVRVDEAWTDLLDQTLRAMGPVADERLDRSRLIRLLGDYAAACWLRAPYVARRSDHFVFVSSSGDVFYRALQELRLGSSRANLPAGITMKPERRAFYTRREPDWPNHAQHIRKQWIINHFSSWLGSDFEPPAGKVLAAQVDRFGITSKFADLAIEQPKDRTVMRETIVGFRNYVQRKGEGDTTDDRGDIPIDIPTTDLDMKVMIDCGLYGNSIDGATAAGFEIRNRESARFRQEDLSTPENPLLWTNGKSSTQNPSPGLLDHLGQIDRSFDGLQKRLISLSGPENLADDGEPVVRDQSSRVAIASLARPAEFLFGRLRWHRPHLGLEVCLTWNKPRPGDP